MNRLKWISVLILILGFMAYGSELHAATTKKWTLMVYLDADNDLERNGIDDFLEMAKVGSNQNVNIVLLFDRCRGYDSRYTNWTKTRRGLVKKGDKPTNTWGEFLGEKDMGDPQTIIDFVSWAVPKYPAEKYAFVYWNHGDGWRTSPEDRHPVTRSICFDEDSGDSELHMSDVYAAMKRITSTTVKPQILGKKIDLISFDACLMGMLEVAHGLKDYAHVMNGSQELEPGGGWPYDKVLNDLVAKPNMTAAELGSSVTNRFNEAYPRDAVTQSTLDLAKIPQVVSALDTFSNTLITKWKTDSRACANSGKAVRDAITAAVINEKHTKPMNDSHGIAIYFPELVTKFDSAYNNAVSNPMSKDCKWDEFLAAYYKSMTTSWVSKARDEVRDFDLDARNRKHVDLYDLTLRLAKELPDPLSLVAADQFNFSMFSTTLPAAQSGQLTNYGDTACKWEIKSNATWLTPSKSSGTLTANNKETITFALNQVKVAALKPGSYKATISIINKSTNTTTTKQVTFIYKALFIEDFEEDTAGANLPDNWKNVDVNNKDLPWFVSDVNSYDEDLPSTSATFEVYKNSEKGAITKMQTPAIDMSMVDSAKLTFKLKMSPKRNRSDRLKVYSKTSATARWTLLKTYSRKIPRWTNQQITISKTSATTYLAFEGAAVNGDGIFIDDIKVTADQLKQSKSLKTKKWTFLVYLDADNDLERYAIDNFLQMAKVGTTDDVNIAVQFDRTSGFDSRYGDWENTRRGLVKRGDTPTAQWGAAIGEKDMGVPSTLQEFIKWGVDNYPAEKYAMVMWNHGNGWRSSFIDGEKPVFRSICSDRTNGSELQMKQVYQILNQAVTPRGDLKKKFDLISFDACLMGMTEVAYGLRNCAKVMTGSEELVPGAGWPYNKILEKLTADADMDAAQLSGIIVKDYSTTYIDEDNCTQAAIDLSKMDNVRLKLDSLARALIRNWQTSPTSCVPYCEPLRQAIDAAVIHERHTIAQDGSHGLAIYFPTTSATYIEEYDNALHCPLSGVCAWDEFISAYPNGMNKSWLANVKRATRQYHTEPHIDLVDFCDNISKYLPKMVSVRLTNSRNQIEVQFNTEMSSGVPSQFTLRNGSKVVKVKSVALKEGDSRTVRLTLENPLPVDSQPVLSTTLTTLASITPNDTKGITVTVPDQSEFLVELNKGWNMIALPFAISNDKLCGKVSPVGSVWQWNAQTQKYDVIAKGGQVEAMKGVWFFSDVKQDGTFFGTPVTTNPYTNLRPKWNMIGVNPTHTALPEAATTWCWQDGEYSKVTDQLEVGKAYWILK